MEEKSEQPGVQNPAHVLAKRLQENRKSLHIARIPDKTKEAFIALAEEEFCGDYGMTLKWLIDDIPSQDTRMIIAKLEEQEARLQALESATHTSEEVPDENKRKMLSGREIVVKGVRKK
ncbi:MAG TPA: hypothetical protein VMX17_12985 [Candidatus Glassbacteria bacterium]|nr:hypothetical protein [Candidatus Glassbacteria bacterium]